MNKFDKKYLKIIQQINSDKQRVRFIQPYFNYPINPKKLFYYKQDSFLQLYKNLICEDYKIFPVPRDLLNDILNFSLTHNSMDQKKYQCKDLLTDLVIQWPYYQQFKQNIQLMLKQNYNCSITVVLFQNLQDLKKIFKKYPNDDLNNKINQQTFGIAYSYNDKFDVCLAINCSIKDKFILHKTIQHQLMHWMQVTLNSHTEKNYGKFPKDEIKLNIFDKHTLAQLGVDKEYLLDWYQFQPWVANTCEQFQRNHFNLNQYKDIIQNNQKFIDAINNQNNIGKRQMLIFGKVCYLASLNKNQDYWWYLIEALKQNKY